MIGLGVLKEFEQNVAEAEHGADRRAVGAGQRRQRVIGAEDVARAVDQINVMQLAQDARVPDSAADLRDFPYATIDHVGKAASNRDTPPAPRPTNSDIPWDGP